MEGTGTITSLKISVDYGQGSSIENFRPLISWSKALEHLEIDLMPLKDIPHYENEPLISLNALRQMIWPTRMSLKSLSFVGLYRKPLEILDLRGFDVLESLSLSREFFYVRGRQIFAPSSLQRIEWVGRVLNDRRRWSFETDDADALFTFAESAVKTSLIKEFHVLMKSDEVNDIEYVMHGIENQNSVLGRSGIQPNRYIWVLPSIILGELQPKMEKLGVALTWSPSSQ
jgi:hypothetical protein